MRPLSLVLFQVAYPSPIYLCLYYFRNGLAHDDSSSDGLRLSRNEICALIVFLEDHSAAIIKDAGLSSLEDDCDDENELINWILGSPCLILSDEADADSKFVA